MRCKEPSVKQDEVNGRTKNLLLSYAQLLEEIGRDYMEEGIPCSQIKCSREYLLEHRQANLNRVLVGRFVLDAALQLEKIAKDCQRTEAGNPKRERILFQQLKRAGLLVKRYEKRRNRNGYLEIGMVVSALGADFYTVSDLADCISKVEKTCMLPMNDGYQYVHKDPIYLLFEEDTPYVVESGYARAIKDQELISGDHYLLRDFGDGTFIGAIADGMGSGELAAKDSEKALSLLERYLEAGLLVEDLICNCNRLFYLRKDLEQSVTLDIFSCNLYTLEADLYKYGAAGSFLIRGKKVRFLSRGGVGLGIYPKEKGSFLHLFLKPDDILILMSDGVMDYYEQKRERFEEMLSSFESNSLKDFATHILQTVMNAQKGVLLDDMTVLVFQILQKEG